MKNNQKLTLLPWLKKSKATSDGKAPVYVRITTGGSSEETSINRKIHPDFWDAENKIDKEKSADAKRTNLLISEAETNLRKHFTVLQTKFESITALMLKNVYEGRDPFAHSRRFNSENSNQTEHADATLLQAFDQYILTFEKKVNKGIRDEGTLKHWNTTRNKLAAFLTDQYQLNDIQLSQVRYKHAEDFFDYLTLDAKRTISEVTAKTHVKKTRQILKNSVKKGLISKNPFEDYVCSCKEPEVQPLELYQLEMIIEKKFTSPRMEEIRDSFVAQCFTGFAYQDLDALSGQHIIKVGISGEEWFSNPRGKTEVLEVVPILPIVKEIIEKYSRNEYCLSKNKLFPIKSNQKYNEYLKELAVLCGIPRKLTTHLARHTFADIMLSNGAPLEDVQKMLGHKSIRTTQRYARVRKERISANMKKVKSALFTASGKFRKVA